MGVMWSWCSVAGPRRGSQAPLAGKRVPSGGGGSVTDRTEWERRPDFEAAYLDNLDRVYGFVAYRVGWTPVAEDLTQATFEKALRAWNRFDPQKGSVVTWLFSIARNVVVDHLRLRKEILFAEGDTQQIADPEVAPIELGVSAELAAALEKLNPRERTVLALKFGADLTGPEIGELMSLSTDNVHQILSRSLRKLRSWIEAGRA